MSEVLCLKKNGKIKVVHNQFELNALDKDKYEAYLVQVGMFSSVFKAMTPGSGWLKPIKKIHIYYSLDRLMEGSFEYYSDEEDDPVGCHIAEYGGNEVEFTDILDFIYFIVSLEKIASMNVMGNGSFGHAIFMAGFHMTYIDMHGHEIEYDVPKRLLKKDQLKSYGFTILTLVKGLMEFFGDDDKKFTNPDFYGRRYAYITPDLKQWNLKPSSTNDLVTIPMTQCGCCTLVVSYIFTILDTYKYMGKVDITTYTCVEEEHNLPFDVPITADLITTHYEVFNTYDDYTYNLVTAADIIEMAAMLPYYIKTIRDYGQLSCDEMTQILTSEWSIIAQLKLWDNGKRKDGNFTYIPLKHIIYESELPELEMDESLSRFIKTLLLWIEEPKSVDGIDEDDMMPF